QRKALIGWYRTQPDRGIFLSETDLERTRRVLFSEPFQVALVYDPVRGRAGYFFWEGAQTIDAAQAAWREFDIAIAFDADEDPAAAAPTAQVEAADVEVAAVAPAAVLTDASTSRLAAPPACVTIDGLVDAAPAA